MIYRSQVTGLCDSCASFAALYVQTILEAAAWQARSDTEKLNSIRGYMDNLRRDCARHE